MAGLHAFLMTDLVGSTPAMRKDRAALRSLLEDHDHVLERAAREAGGRVFKHTGDGVCVAFSDPVEAVRAAVAAQRELSSIDAAVRMALDVGVADARGDDFFGLALSRCARVLSVSSGGQILVTLAVEELLRDALPDDVQVQPIGMVRLRGFEDSDALFQVVAPGLRRNFPTIDDHVRVRFPAPRSTLIGRERELAQVLDLVRAGSVVTLVGAGGVGKTRLALEVLALEGAALGGGVFVDLSVVEDSSVVVQKIADTVGMQFATENARSQLFRFLSGRSLLLVLDNCEHVLSEVAALADELVDRCSGVALLATTREPLHVTGERTVRLGSLAVQDAARLFSDRLARAGGGTIEALQAGVVIDICAHLDGIPLAVELAAAQAARLPLTTLRSLLTDSIDVLTGSTRTVRRHQALQHTLEWSYELLSAEEQRLLRHVAVFQASFSVDGAACVAGGTRIETALTLGSLVDKSLVVFDVGASGYRLLETVRAFARGQLAAAGETDAAFDRLRIGILDQSPGPWACWLNLPPSQDASYGIDNVRGVLEWCLGRDRPHDCITLAASNLNLWFHTGRAAEALRWLNVLPEEQVTDDVTRAAIVARSWVAFSMIDVDTIQAVPRARHAVPDDHAAARSLQFLIAWANLERGVTTLDRTIAAVRETSNDDVHWQHCFQVLRGFALLLDRRYREAVEELEWAATGEGADAHYARQVLATAYHLDCRHDDVAEMRRALVESEWPIASFSDLITVVVAIVDHVGRREPQLACAQLRTLLDRTESDYAHVPLIWGFAVEAAAVIAAFAGRDDDAVALLTGSRRNALHYRYEGVRALGDHYGRIARERLTRDALSTAEAHGASLSVRQLVDLARTVCDDESHGG